MTQGDEMALSTNDENDYPTEIQLLAISAWPANDFVGLMEFIEPLWKYADSGYWTEEDGEYRISTAGWSGNEEIIFYMQQNHVWWMMFWQQSRRGGHYIFGPTRR
jgi:hypothetical protein